LDVAPGGAKASGGGEKTGTVGTVTPMAASIVKAKGARSLHVAMVNGVSTIDRAEIGPSGPALEWMCKCRVQTFHFEGMQGAAFETTSFQI
jgi:hypothetical protein